VDNRTEVRAFLSSRRARLKPDQAGLPAYGGNRRVPGLRREEVAMLSGLSVDYYVQLERGNLKGVSENVLNAVANALQLDDAERTHLFDLARAANASGTKPRRPSPQKVRAGLQRVLDATTDAPAWIRNGRADMVAVLRAEAGRNPYDRGLTDLIGELSTRSEKFCTLWATHDVMFHRTGQKRLHHPIVGDLDLTYEAFDLPGDPGLRMLVYTAEPASPTADALNLLASWAATQDPAEREQVAHATDEP
jgi:transcriptional regulator with XRE-family HTH domain